MNRLFMVLMSVLLLGAPASFVSAHSEEHGVSKGEGQKKGQWCEKCQSYVCGCKKGKWIDAKVEKLTKELKLKKDQQEKLRAILKEKGEKKKAIMKFSVIPTKYFPN